jgi:hypothetical protein
MGKSAGNLTQKLDHFCNVTSQFETYLLHALQFRPHPSNLEGHACDGGWGNSQALGNV